TLRSYFSQYGEVVDCVIMKDKTTNQSRGFGFVKFKDPNCVGTVLASRPHTLDGRNQKGSRSDNNKSNKIFVGGIPHNCGETELREYFKKFGVVSHSARWQLSVGCKMLSLSAAFSQISSSCQILG
ncbi:UNVERIFIED_CONTAM: hypothetical protein H355_013590, partial [Colinus virginianus]